MMKRLQTFLTTAAALGFFAQRAVAQHIEYDIGNKIMNTVGTLGTKLVLAVLIVSVSAIICCVILRKR